MSAHQVVQPHQPGATIAAWFTWLGGGDRRELRESHERSAHSVTGVVVLINVALSWLVTTLAVWPATHRWPLAVVTFTFVFALLVGVTARAIAAGPTRRTSRSGAAAVAVVLALVLGAIAGESAALALFSGSIDRLIQQGAERNAVSAPAVAQETTNLRTTREARAALDHAVDTARAQRDEALVVARCEYHPTPACPQTRITGVPGSGPETRTANELLADSQRELDQAVAARDRQSPALEARIYDDERALDHVRQHATTDPDRGVGARWAAMQQLTADNAGMLTLRILTDGFFVLLGLMPLILRQWRGDTSHDLHVQARAERERAELVADTAIAIKRAEVRAAAETLWAEQQLAQARLAVEAQTEIDRAQLRQRVIAAAEIVTPDPEPVADDIYLPIAAEAHAASLAAGPSATVDVGETTNLPATREQRVVPTAQARPTIPDATRAAARWIRPLVPDFLGRAIDTSTHPFRTARQVIEEVEHITFSLTRTRRVTVEGEEGGVGSAAQRSTENTGQDDHDNELTTKSAVLARATSPQDQALAPGRREPKRELINREGRRELGAASGPRQLPPAE